MNTARTFAGIGICALLISFSRIGMAEQNRTVEVVTHSAVSDTHLSRSRLTSIFTVRVRSWSGDHPIKVFVLPDDNPHHIAFCRQVLRLAPYKLRRAWERMVFSGTGQAPVELADLEGMRERVANTPGAIGYLSPAAMMGETRVMRID